MLKPSGAKTRQSEENLSIEEMLYYEGGGERQRGPQFVGRPTTGSGLRGPLSPGQGFGGLPGC